LIAFHTSYLGALLQNRLYGFAAAALSQGQGRRYYRSALYSTGTTCSWKVLQQSESMDRAGSSGDIFLRGGAAAPVSRSALILQGHTLRTRVGENQYERSSNAGRDHRNFTGL